MRIVFLKARSVFNGKPEQRERDRDTFFFDRSLAGSRPRRCFARIRCRFVLAERLRAGRLGLGHWTIRTQISQIGTRLQLSVGREIARDGEGKNIGHDKKDRRKRESGSKRRDRVERKGKGIAKKGETTKGTALQLLPGAPEMMSLSSKPEPKT